MVVPAAGPGQTNASLTESASRRSPLSTVVVRRPTPDRTVHRSTLRGRNPPSQVTQLARRKHEAVQSSDHDCASESGPSTDRGGVAAWQDLTDSLPQPTDAAERDDLLWQELNALFRWYERAATRTRLSYQTLKVAALIAGAVVTVLAAARAPAVLTAGLAATIVIVEGIQQVFRFHRNWIVYRATAEALRQNAFLYVAGMDPYSDISTRRAKLADVLRDLTSKENASWAATMRQATPSSTSDG